MKRIIDGVTYNTDTSTLIARAEGKLTMDDGIEYDSLEHLYQTRGGAFFVHEHLEGQYHDQEEGRWRTKKSDNFTPSTHEEATAWLNEAGDVELFSDVLGEPPEATAEQEKGATIYIRVPESLKRRIDESAKSDGLSVNSWAMRCLEDCATEKYRVLVQDEDDPEDAGRVVEVPLTTAPLRGHEEGPRGSAPEYLRLAFHEIFTGENDTVDETIEIRGEKKPWAWLFAKLWNCTDLIPQEVWGSTSEPSTYGRAVRLKANADDILDDLEEAAGIGWRGSAPD